MAKNKIYPFAVASVRAMENKLLTKQKLMQMAEAKNAEEALRLLADTDYGKTQVRDVHDFEEMIQNNLEESYESIQKLIPNETFMNIFLFKNDYHNIKVLIKEEISDVSGRKFMAARSPSRISAVISANAITASCPISAGLWKKPLTFTRKPKTGGMWIPFWIKRASGT